MKKFFIALFISSTFLLGCASTASLHRSTFSYNFLQESIRQNYETISSLYGEGKVTVEAPSFAQTGSFKLYVSKPDSLFLLLQGPFGIKVGSALISRQDFYFYNSIQNKLFSGATTQENLNKALNIPLTFDDLLSVVTGGNFFAEDYRQPDSIIAEPENIILQYKSVSGERKYWIDSQSFNITKIQIIDTNGKIMVEQLFKNFQTLGKHHLPTLLQIYHIPNKQRLSLSFSTLTIEKAEIPEIQFTYPQNIEHIHW
ncbi:MAG: DUF4292 domain-containing protein [Bacteroidetes bacterium]|nr:DUF4292 domain-containing protein [Bacteroidota bacterium]